MQNNKKGVNNNATLFLDKFFFALAFIIFGLLSAQAQTWEHTYRTGEGKSLIQLADDDYFILGESTSEATDDKNILLLRTDALGNELWAKELGQFGDDKVITATLDIDNHIIIAVELYDSVNQNTVPSLKKLDVNDGKEIWSTITPNGIITERIDGGVTLVYATENIFSISFYDQSGSDLNEVDPIYQEEIASGYNYTPMSIAPTRDGGYIISGFATLNQELDAFIFKVDGLGNKEWINVIENQGNARAIKVIQTQDGGYIATGDLTGIGLDRTGLFRLDATGRLLWKKNLPGNLGTDIVEAQDGGILVSAYSNILTTGNFDALLIQTDEEGNLLGQQSFGSDGQDFVDAFIQTNDGQFALVGNKEQEDNSSAIFLLKTRSLSTNLTNKISGTVFFDKNNNTNLETDEDKLKHWIIEAKGKNTYYGSSDDLGNYTILTDTGTYEIRLITPNNYWSVAPSRKVQFDVHFEEETLNYPVQEKINCPNLFVDISTPVLIPCEESIYAVQFRNNGTAAAEGVYIEIELDNNLTFIEELSGNFTPSISADNIVTFEIGQLNVSEEGAIYFKTLLSCVAQPIGKAHQVNAHIFPDDFCQVNDNWNQSSLKLKGNCNEARDSVFFNIENIGINPTDATQQFVVIQDHVIFRQGITPTLAPAQTLSIGIPATGATMRMTVDQVENHPGKSMPSLAIEGCGTNELGEISLGFVTQYPEDDANDFVSIDIQESQPNEYTNLLKTYPKGYGEHHLISADTEIEYHQQFRLKDEASNPIKRLVIRDTLSTLLDPSSLILGASSHPYEFELYRGGIIKFTFSNLDSTTSLFNEESLGFVKYRISPYQEIATGNQIVNRLFDYVDYSAPKVSTELFHTIGENYIEVDIISSITNSPQDRVAVNFYPNPFTDQATLTLPYNYQQLTLLIYDESGRLQQSIQAENEHKIRFFRENMLAGMYIFQLMGNDKQIATGKIVLH